MKYRVIIEARAMEDLESIVEWIAQDSEVAARHWYGSVTDAIESLEEFPARCPMAPESSFVRREIRQLLHGASRKAYRILFTICEDAVHVLHVRHWARNWMGPEELDMP